MMNKPNKVFPEGISLEDQGSTRIITYRWYSSFYIPLFVFFMFWDGFLLCYFIQTVVKHEPDLWGSVLFAIPHTLVGLVMTYYLIAIVVNETVIELSNFELKVIHTPLPWWGNQTVNLLEIESVFCDIPLRRGGSHRADIVLFFNNGEKKKLLSSIQNWKSARFIRDQMIAFRNRAFHLGDSPSLPSISLDVFNSDTEGSHSSERFGNIVVVFLLLILIGMTCMLLYAFRSITIS